MLCRLRSFREAKSRRRIHQMKEELVFVMDNKKSLRKGHEQDMPRFCTNAKYDLSGTNSKVTGVTLYQVRGDWARFSSAILLTRVPPARFAFCAKGRGFGLVSRRPTIECSP